MQSFSSWSRLKNFVCVCVCLLGVPLPYLSVWYLALTKCSWDFLGNTWDFPKKIIGMHWYSICLSWQRRIADLRFCPFSIGSSLALPILDVIVRSSKAHEHKDFWKTSKPCCVGIHWIALADYSQMSTHKCAWVSVISCFLHHFS